MPFQNLCARACLCVGLLSCLLFAQRSVAESTPTALPAVGFVRVLGSHFVDASCRDFVWAGYNSWATVERGAGLKPGGYRDYSGALEKDMTTEFEVAAAHNLTVVRFFGHGTGDNFTILQLGPGRYDEQMFIGLDRAIYEAGRHSMRVVLTFSSNWKISDSKQAFAAWAGLRDTSKFYADLTARQLFRDHILAIVQRVNTFTGIAYRDDPTILAWNLMNEPRCDCLNGIQGTSLNTFACSPDCADDLDAWVGDMSAYVKSVDPNHLVTVGEEGFYGIGSPLAASNPDGCNPLVAAGPNAWANGASLDMCWAQLTGQDFVRNHEHPAVDFTAVHMWADSWFSGPPSLLFTGEWIRSHINATRKLRKPMIMEEFGQFMDLSDPVSALEEKRNPLYLQVLRKTYTSIDTGDVLRAAMFWRFAAWDRTQPVMVPGMLEAVYTDDSTLVNNVRPYAKAIQSVRDSLPLLDGCAPVGSGASTSFSTEFVLPTLPWQMQADPSATYYVSQGPGLLALQQGVALPGSPLSDVDPTACARACDGTPGCDSFAFSPAHKQCWLNQGASTEYRPTASPWQTFWQRRPPQLSACTPSTCVAVSPALYYQSSGPGVVALDQGDNLASSPLENATPLRCGAACFAAPECSSFAYNPASGQCWLKSGGSTLTSTGSSDWQTFWRRVGSPSDVNLCLGWACTVATALPPPTATYYETAGAGLLAIDQGANAVSEVLEGADPESCSAACDAVAYCAAFSYSATTGQCWLKTGSSASVAATQSRWQTYWKRAGVNGASKACPADNCALCADPTAGWAAPGTCLMCYPGYVRVLRKEALTAAGLVTDAVQGGDVLCQPCSSIDSPAVLKNPACQVYPPADALVEELSKFSVSSVWPGTTALTAPSPARRGRPRPVQADGELLLQRLRSFGGV